MTLLGSNINTLPTLSSCIQLLYIILWMTKSPAWSSYSLRPLVTACPSEWRTYFDANDLWYCLISWPECKRTYQSASLEKIQNKILRRKRGNNCVTVVELPNSMQWKRLEPLVRYNVWTRSRQWHVLRPCRRTRWERVIGCISCRGWYKCNGNEEPENRSIHIEMLCDRYQSFLWDLDPSSIQTRSRMPTWKEHVEQI